MLLKSRVEFTAVVLKLVGQGLDGPLVFTPKGIDLGVQLLVSIAKDRVNLFLQCLVIMIEDRVRLLVACEQSVPTRS